MTEATQPVQVTTFTCEDDSWYTPSWIVELVRRVLGEIDLDPCSSEVANWTVKATEYYTVADNGLMQPWHGRVFCNPPSRAGDKTARPHLWANKLLGEYETGRVASAVLLVKSVLGYKWYERLYEHYWVCHLTERPAFARPDGTDCGPCKKGVSVFYFGEDWQRFMDVFAECGKKLQIGEVGNSVLLRTDDEKVEAHVSMGFMVGRQGELEYLSLNLPQNRTYLAMDKGVYPPSIWLVVLPEGLTPDHFGWEGWEAVKLVTLMESLDTETDS
jgi:hypothetical protein